MGGPQKGRGDGARGKGSIILGLRVVFGLGLLSLAVMRCAVGPEFKKPQIEVPSQWTEREGPGWSQGSAKQLRLARWWEIFQDPLLSSLIQRAITSNLDLKLAESRIQQARAARKIAAGFLGPKIEGTGSFRTTRTPVKVLARPGEDERTEGIVSEHYEAGFDAGWELDLLGGRRRGLEAAEADLRASIEERRDVMVRLVAEVAREYWELRALQERIRVAEKNLEAQKKTAEITQKRYEAGFASALDVANAKAQAATTESQIPALQALERQRMYSLGLLLGQPPGELIPELSTPSAELRVPAFGTIGVPSELLRRRPDIRRAEEELHAATARVGVAVSELFPKFTITGTLAFQASDVHSWLQWVNRMWSFGPGMSWRLFETGRIRAEIERTEAIKDQAFIYYRQTVLLALKEVEDALISLAREEEHRRLLMEAVEANRRAVDLALKLYIEGQTDFLNVLQAQRSLYASEDELIQSIRTSCIQLVALYKALGGGWDEEPAPEG